VHKRYKIFLSPRTTPSSWNKVRRRWRGVTDGDCLRGAISGGEGGDGRRTRRVGAWIDGSTSDGRMVVRGERAALSGDRKETENNKDGKEPMDGQGQYAKRGARKSPQKADPTDKVPMSTNRSSMPYGPVTLSITNGGTEGGPTAGTDMDRTNPGLSSPRS
jgi:hypothetical protein